MARADYQAGTLRRGGKDNARRSVVMTEQEIDRAAARILGALDGTDQAAVAAVHALAQEAKALHTRVAHISKEMDELIERCLAS